VGAWGSGPFENDSALDWVRDFLDGADLDEALTFPVADAAHIDVDEGSAAVAAAEVVAAINGRPSDDLPEEVRIHLSTRRMKPSKRRTRQALRALDRLSEEDSELKRLWDDAGEGAWAAGIRGLRRRLLAAPIEVVVPAPMQRRRVAPVLAEPRTLVDLTSPTGAYQVWIYESDSPAGANTQGMLSSLKNGIGSGLFMVMGTGLGISARWIGEDRLELAIPARLEVRWAAGAPERPIQFFDQKVSLVPRRT
jgi:hypothetical protein